MPKYRVKAGQTFGNHNQYGAGAVVELTEAEAAGFLDKLEPVTGAAAILTHVDDESDETEETTVTTKRKSKK